MKIETKIELEHRLHERVKQRLKDSINDRMTERIKYFQNKNKTLNKHPNNSQKNCKEKLNNVTNHLIHNHNHTNFKSYPECFTDNTKIKELEEFRNSSDYEARWGIAIDKWTRNWNFYREQLTNGVLEKINMNNKRQKRQTEVDFVELPGQNISGSATVPQNIFIEHYDCDAEEITNVKYYELNKIRTCKFKPLDLDMTKTVIQLLSKAQAVKIKAYAVTGTIKQRVEWCSQHTDYIRANRPSYYASDTRRTKILDKDEVRNELARFNLLKNTKYKPTRYIISFNFIANPPLQKKIEDMQGRIQFEFDTPMVQFDAFMVKYQDRYGRIVYGRIVYDCTNPIWIPNALKNAQSNCMEGPRKQNRIDILDWKLEIKEVSSILNLDTEEISYMGTKILRKGECLPTPFTKATIV